MEMDRELLGCPPPVKSLIIAGQSRIHAARLRAELEDQVNDDTTSGMKSINEINHKIAAIKKKLKSADELLEYAVRTDTCVGNMMQVHARKTVKYTAEIKTLEWVLNNAVEEPSNYPWEVRGAIFEPNNNERPEMNMGYNHE